MANRSRTKDLYDALVDAYRRAPGNAMHAAKIAGCDRRTAKRAWEAGWPDKGEWAPAIKITVQAELEASRDRATKARVSKDNLKDGEARELADARRQEGVLVRQTRANAILAANSIAQLMRGLQPAAQMAGEQLEKELRAGKTPKLDEVLAQLGKLSYAAQKIADVMDTVVRVERVVLGPNSGATGDNPGLVVSSEDEATEILDAAARARERINRKKAPGLVVVQGGKVGP